MKAAKPLFDNTEQTNKILKDLPKTRKVLEGLRESLNSPEIRKLLGKKVINITSTMQLPSQRFKVIISNK